MADARTILSTVLYCLWLPTSKLLSAVAFVLSPFWALLQFIFLPVTYLLHAIYTIVSFPFRLHILERLEAIYIWVGVAALVGSIAGVVLFLVFKFIASALKIDGTTITPAKAPCRTVQDFRATRRMKKEPHSGSPSGPRIDKVAAMRRRGLSSHPILEDEFEF